MTKRQMVDFGKLEMAYLDSVRLERSQSEQRQCLEVIFYWMGKILTDEGRRTAVLKGIAFDADQRMILSDNLKAEFGFLQIALVSAWQQGNHTEMVEVEIKMREWIDMQLNKAANKGFKPKMRIIPANGGNRKN
jgi:hypothetical protein